jgi:hypothetical protein
MLGPPGSFHVCWVHLGDRVSTSARFHPVSSGSNDWIDACYCAAISSRYLESGAAALDRNIRLR